MNLVGKILVVALLVMSLVFASLTLAVHATHTNWLQRVTNTDKSKGPPGLVQDLADKDSALQRKITELTEMERLKERTTREYEVRVAQQESQNQELLAVRLNLQTENTQKAGQLKEAISAADNAAKLLEKTQEENKVIREENVVTKKARDDNHTQLVAREDDLAQAKGEWARLEARNKQLLAQLAQYRLALQNAGVNLNLQTPAVQGLVTKTHTTEKMVEINLGTDHGLREGDLMDVYRLGNTLASTAYLGQIRLFKMDKTTAVGSVIPDKLKGTIQENDHVATRIK